MQLLLVLTCTVFVKSMRLLYANAADVGIYLHLFTLITGQVCETKSFFGPLRVMHQISKAPESPMVFSY